MVAKTAKGGAKFFDALYMPFLPTKSEYQSNFPELGESSESERDIVPPQSLDGQVECFNGIARDELGKISKE